MATINPTDWDAWDVKKNVPKPPGETTTAAVAPPVAPPVSGKIGLTPGYTPNYQALILSDPSYLDWKNNSDLDLNQAAAQRKAALQALVVQHGGAPQGFKDAYGDIDQTTLDLASRNQFSDVARLEKNYGQGVEAMRRSLAARHALQSGELPYGQQQADYARAGAEYDLGNQFGNATQGVVNDYLGRETAVRHAQATALQTAEQNVYANPLNRPAKGTEAQLDPDWQAKYGVPVYSGPDGTLFMLDASGNPVPYKASFSVAPGDDWRAETGAASSGYSPRVASDALASVLFNPYRRP